MSEADQISFLKNLDQLREVGSSITIRGMSSGFRMKDIVKSLQQEFIAYQGSLTTPPCSEAVSWLVARNPMKISRNDVSILVGLETILIGIYFGGKLFSYIPLFPSHVQMIAFRKIYGLNELLTAPNYRPMQARNGRFCLNF